MIDIREQFPILQTKVYQRPLIYFDNAATTQKPLCVIEAMDEYYRTYNSNIHRGAHYLANKATEAYEDARKLIAQLINASPIEINFTKGTTESINLLAYAWGRKFIKEGDEIIISHVEHHANIVPWQILCAEKKAILKVIPIDDEGNFTLDVLDEWMGPQTKLISVNYVSNALGNINPIHEIIQKAKQHQIPVHLDLAQAVHHFSIDVKALQCDFASFSGHKMYGPTGTGIFWAKEAILLEMNPFLSGGEMIKKVSFSGTTFNDLPYKFEAGTPNIAGGIGLGAAATFLSQTGLQNIQARETELVQYALNKMRSIDRFILYGNLTKKSSVISFNVDGVHGYDIGVVLDRQGIAVRTGHHCCQPLMERLGVEGTIRISLAFYNTEQEIDVFIEALKKAIQLLS